MTKSTLSFDGYRVQNMEFSMGKNMAQENCEVELPVSFDRKVGMISDEKDDYEFLIKFNCTIGSKNAENGFYLNLSMVGHFTATEKNDLYVGNASAILFPYLRTTISNICVAANIPAFYLPIINTQMFFDSTDEESQN